MIRTGHYILNEDHSVTKVDTRTTKGLLEWAVWFEKADRHVERTRVAPGISVSTVFLGLDHNFSERGPPLLFETMVFDDYGGNDTWRWHDWDEAVEGHARIVAELRERLKDAPAKEPHPRRLFLGCD
jgi:hypothetical protein